MSDVQISLSGELRVCSTQYLETARHGQQHLRKWIVESLKNWSKKTGRVSLVSDVLPTNSSFFSEILFDSFPKIGVGDSTHGDEKKVIPKEIGTQFYSSRYTCPFPPNQ